MDTYEYPLGVTFKAATPEHAAARVFGGKPADYLATVHESRDNSLGSNRWVEVTSVDGTTFHGDIPLVTPRASAEESWAVASWAGGPTR